jgi:hypothetical protein
MIRAWRPVSDRAFVASSWISSFRVSHWSGPIPDDLYASTYSGIIDRILDTRGVSVLVECDPTDENQILGYAVWGPGRLYYCYVKSPFRDSKAQGEQPKVAMKLLRHLGWADGVMFDFVFRTPQWDKFRQRHRLNARSVVSEFRKGQETQLGKDEAQGRPVSHHGQGRQRDAARRP